MLVKRKHADTFRFVIRYVGLIRRKNTLILCFEQYIFIEVVVLGPGLGQVRKK